MGEGEIKSAFEIAMEKVNRMSEPTVEERLQWKYVPEGEMLGGRFLKEKVNLVSEVGEFDGAPTRERSKRSPG